VIVVCFGTVVWRLIKHITKNAEGVLFLCRIQIMVSPSFEERPFMTLLFKLTPEKVL